ncbi:phosphate ABC transporter substrate-binding protein, PhoT family [Yoonia tamlensis]|uniref:Phosphate ABC transporter substrate-binding protein, PhoT family n=1 Tax=Yoonia tamlensis TaxID=390270 RepID=A0A1I6HLQ2_9RHOB|nr:phosphate ABC transporter substrate-binding/OmpA family protein [Yoonia tamlensis]SFR55267.1 phosphate ABC transporter substrate-binding protein, PhoT family [Yoonia tamlensis]
MMSKRKHVALGMITIASGLAFAGMTQAGEVTLSSADGTVNMTGEFIDFQDNAYIISTALGELRVAASRVSCSGDSCPSFGAVETDITIAGSDVVGSGLMPLLLEGYAGSLDAASTENAGQPGQLVATLTADQGFGDDIVSFLVDSKGSTEGFEILLADESEIAMSSRRIVPDEARSLRDAGAGNMVDPAQEHIIAIDSLVMITNAANPIETLTTEQVRAIYSGEISNWSQVDGPDLPITVVTQSEDSGTRAVFEERIFGEAGAPLASGAVIASSGGEASQLVNETQGAIGVVGYSFQRGANPVNLINECGITMTPDAFSARTEEYALQRRLYLYTREDTISDQSRAFVNYATSNAADSLIGKAGFIGFGVDRREQSLDSSRALSLLDPSADAYEAGFMRAMLGQMVDYDRLSTTFRFRTGSAQLDERGRIDRDRLVSYLETQPAGTEVLLVGFTDDVGQFDGNRDLSEQRAAQVLQELIAFAGDRMNNISFSSVGYGEIAPSGCNADQEGRRINRRVEVWIKSPA